MTNGLLDIVRRHADAAADRDGVAPTVIPGLSALRALHPSELQVGIYRPMVALVLQGRKRVGLGTETFDFGAGDSLMISADVPTVSEITKASAGEPYYALVIDLDPALIESLVAEIGALPETARAPIRVEATKAEVADAALRLMRLIDRPGALPVLSAQLLRELHYWLLVGPHGAAIRGLGTPGSHAQRIARAVDLLRSDYARALRVEDLAERAGMSASSFHQHFRAITSLTPLQFQKRLRLIEARRLMLSDGATTSHAAFGVGYESVPQFTRDYGRLFGLPPARDIREARERLRAAA